MMDGTFIDVVINKLQWLFDHPEVTWSGSGIYALSLAGSAAFAVAACMRRRKKKSPLSSEEHLRQPLPAQKTDNQFNSNGGEQNIAQGDHAIGKQVNNYGIPPEVFAQYVRDLGVTDSALASFFKILEEQQIPRGDLDSKLREIAFRYKELLLRFEAVTSDDPQVQALKEQARQAIENGEYDRADALLNQAKERDRAAVATLKASLAEQQAALEKRQLSEAQSCVSQAKLQRLQYRYEKSAQYFQEAAAALPEGCKLERAVYLGGAGYDLNNISRYADALCLYEQSLSISREIGDREGEGVMLNNIGMAYKDQGEDRKSLDYLEQSLLVRRKINDYEGESMTLNNIATIYHANGDCLNALSCLKQSLILHEKINDKRGIGLLLNNIGEIYRQQVDALESLQYYEHSLSVSREIEDNRLESTCLNNISQVYQDQGKLDVALEYLEQSLELSWQIGDRRTECATLNNIGQVYEAKEDYTAALKQYKNSLAIAQDIGIKAKEAGGNWNIGWLYAKQGDLLQAERYISSAVDLLEQLEAPDLETAREGLEAVRAKLRGQQ